MLFLLRIAGRVASSRPGADASNPYVSFHSGRSESMDSKRQKGEEGGNTNL